jgi:hypothetical protein
VEFGKREIRWDGKEPTDDRIVTVGELDLEEIALNGHLNTV